jgi:hypothetical protein
VKGSVNTMAAENVIATQLTLGMIGAGLLQWLKSQKWLSSVNQNSGTLNHLVLLATSALGGLGIHAAWSGSDHSLTITGLDLAAIAGAAWLWAKQWTIQFLVHRGVFGQVAGAPVHFAGIAPFPGMTGAIPGKIPPVTEQEMPPQK